MNTNKFNSDISFNAIALNQKLGFGDYESIYLKDLIVDNYTYVIKLLLFVDEFYIKDEFNYKFDLYCKTIDYQNLYKTKNVQNNIYDINIVLDRYLTIFNHNSINLDSDIISTDLIINPKDKIYLALYNFFKYKIHIGEPLCDIDKLKVNNYQKYMFDNTSYVDFNFLNCKYSYNELMLNLGESFTQNWNIIEEAILYKEHITQRFRNEEFMDYMTNLELSQSCSYFDKVDDYDYDYNHNYNERNKYYNDNLDMDQQSQEYWDNL